MLLSSEFGFSMFLTSKPNQTKEKPNNTKYKLAELKQLKELRELISNINRASVDFIIKTNNGEIGKFKKYNKISDQ